MEENKRRSEKAGIFNFTKEMVSALLMAFVFIVYVIQAFKIPTGSMKDSLLVGDFLLGLKFVYGAPVLPFTYAKFPGVTDPEPGDVIIFKYPGREKKDYIKRCVAGPGQRIRIEGKDVFVDDKEVKLPPDGKYTRNGNTGEGIRDFEELYIPEKGDTIRVSECGLREFFFLRNLVHQEHPRQEVRAEYNLYVDGDLANNKPYVMLPQGPTTFQSIPFERIDNWKELDYLKTAGKVPMER
ncbi:MAG: signal peptidase I, partial [Chitinivibrionales bacterium]